MAQDNGSNPDAEDVKRKFREALDRKNHKHGNGVEHKDGQAKVGNAHGPLGGKRDFRRKSG
jgi:hypothetical protein